uniref:Calmodulin n=1 Tax=Chromera velia CCMP2878 TaxID=1169474 RepID=A0A0G4HCV0_9ALVE|eukprot:Cvel_6319.t1-p1 / transcript=Cvel_6319.t1 / gene=Cvel_6319 / organism=Chromera_velia_CCMP2878 / gene_product=EF-hand domain-containing family member C2, putative / transcript_product=EF-hand domain-containing family member C2, putative / location=Cvel_scaffold306:88589-94378(-) / protein_length=779 / sequence_SO=supercontig / SO=protein_coding / is_pseudo=false
MLTTAYLRSSLPPKDLGLATENLGEIPKEALPSLPGYQMTERKDQYHKGQRWGFSGGNQTRTRVEVIEGLTHDKPKLVTVKKKPQEWRDGSLPQSTMKAYHSRPEKETVDMPSWEALEHQVLRFYGYFKEHVEESNSENHRVRRVIIYYYLEDDTISLIEPRTDNSGTPQGTLVRRHRVPHLHPGSIKTKQGEYVSPDDLRIGMNVSIYGKVIQVTDCDKFTRDWYVFQQKEPQPEPLETLPDQYVLTRLIGEQRDPFLPMTYDKRYRETMLGGGHMNENMQQFMEWDGKVCRFWAVLDDLSTPLFERRPFVILYFLGDDTIEVRENFPDNCGRDHMPIFFRRGKLPKGGAMCVGPSDPVVSRGELVSPHDFAVGARISLLNQPFFIVDADAFTRRFYSEEMGIELAPKINTKLAPPAWPPQPVPAPTGYGSPEDSMVSVTHLIPKPPRQDFNKLFGNSGKILRFRAKMRAWRSEDQERDFIVSFFLQDDNVMIHEPPVRNSGYVGGRFLQKGRYTNDFTGTDFKFSDFAIGKEVGILGYIFLLTDQDEYTRRIVEDDPPPFPRLEIKSVIEKLRESVKQQFPLVRDMFRKFDRDHNGVMTKVEFASLLGKFGFILTEQELLTVMRHFDLNEDGQVSFNEFCDVILDRDCTDGMLQSHAKTRIRLSPDESYVDAVKETAENLGETDKMRKAVRSVQRVFHEKANATTKLLKEFVRMTTSPYVTSVQIQRAMKELGYEFCLEDVERCVAFVLPEASFDQVDYVTFIQALAITFHDMPHDR